MLTIFKPNKGAAKIVKLTPKIAGKMARKVIIKPTTFEDVLKDIELRAQRGYTWTIMLNVEMETIDKLNEEGWKIKVTNKNEVSQNYIIKIEW